MISLHYVSDRNDTEMWKAQQKADRPELLQHLLQLWNVRGPEISDIPSTNYELFGAAHLWHVAKGQGVLSPEMASIQLDAYNSRKGVLEYIINSSKQLLTQRLVDHGEALAKVRNS
jgi:hypothetical protein